MIRWIFKLIRKFGTLILLAWLLYLGWQHLGPEQPAFNTPRHRLADKAIVEVTEDLRQKRGKGKDVIIFQFTNDHSGYITDQLRDSLLQTGALNPRGRSLWKKLSRKLNLGTGQEQAESRSAAMAAAKSTGAEGALLGSIGKFESSPDAAFLELTYELVDVRTGATACKGEYNSDSNSSALPDAVQKVVEENPWITRGLTWLLLMLALPVFTIRFIRELVARRSNRINLFVLAIYTAIDGLLAVLLIGVTLSTGWGALAFLLLLAIAFAYNARIMTYALGSETDD